MQDILSVNECFDPIQSNVEKHRSAKSQRNQAQVSALFMVAGISTNRKLDFRPHNLPRPRAALSRGQKSQNKKIEKNSVA
jgi:hypothetical protein